MPESKPTSAKSLRTAQYGGVGGSGNGTAWAPGGSPIGRGGTNEGGFGINAYIADQGLDYIMGRTRQDVEAHVDDTRNKEKQLEDFHVHGEEDSIPYELSFEERQKLKLKQMIRRREKSYEDAARSIAENKPEFIKAHFPPKPEHMRTLEESLSERHKAKDNIIRHPFEDDVPPQIAPERVHPVLSQSEGATRTAYQISNPSQMTDRDSDEQYFGNEIESKRRGPYAVPMGKTPVLPENGDLDAFLEDMLTADWGGVTNAPKVPTLIEDTVQPDQVDYPAANHKKTPPSMISRGPENPDGDIDTDDPDIMAIADNPFIPMEWKLEKTRRPVTPEHLPQDPYRPVSWSDYLGYGKDGPLGIADTVMEKSNNSPYSWSGK